MEHDAIAKTFAMSDMRHQRSLWLQNIRANHDLILRNKDIKPLRDVFKNVPGIVIGAGPSLDKQLGLLSEHAREYPLFCTDRAFKKIHSAGIVPHFTVIADWQDVVADFFTGLPTKETILLSSIKASPKVLQLPWKRVLFFLVMDSDKNFEQAEVNMTENRVMGIPGSIICGNTSYLLARWAGCNPITFIGCDMCMAEPNPGEMNYEATDINGNRIFSLPGYLAGFEWLIRYLALDKEVVSGRIKVYNSTEGGIMYAEHVPAKPFAEFLSGHPGAKRSLHTNIAHAIG